MNCTDQNQWLAQHIPLANSRRKLRIAPKLTAEVLEWGAAAGKE
jgi:hypothetical protein